MRRQADEGWMVDPDATRLARETFAGCAPRVRRQGRRYIVEDTPHGLIEFIPVSGRYLVAAEAPPPDAGGAHLRLNRELRDHIQRNRLEAWTVVRGPEFGDALRHLTAPADPAPEGGGAAGSGESWSPYVCAIAPRGSVIGLSRQLLADRLAGLVRAAGGREGPVPCLTGHRGVGKRTVVMEAARKLGLTAVELPLGRLLVDRVFYTQEELLLNTLLAAREGVKADELLVVSQAQCLAALPAGIRQQALLELGRLAHVVLAAHTVAPASGSAADVMTLRCPGLNVAEARELLAREVRDVTPVLPETSWNRLFKAAAARRTGIIPQRFLFLVRLAHALLPPDAEPGTDFFPDDVEEAIRLARQAWQDEEAAGADGAWRPAAGEE